MHEYIPLLVYLLLSTVLSMLILGLSFVFSTQKADPEKVSAYECGFDPFDDARARFDIRFYLVAILFIIFDFWGGYASSRLNRGLKTLLGKLRQQPT